MRPAWYWRIHSSSTVNHQRLVRRLDRATLRAADLDRRGRRLPVAGPLAIEPPRGRLPVALDATRHEVAVFVVGLDDLGLDRSPADLARHEQLGFVLGLLDSYSKRLITARVAGERRAGDAHRSGRSGSRVAAPERG